MMENHDEQKISQTLKEAIHDLNNIFTSNLASIEQLQDLMNTNPVVQKLLTNLNKNSSRAIDITNSLTSNLKTNRTILLKDLLSDVIATANSALTKNVQIRLSHKHSLPKVNGNYTDLYRAFLNLTINALESIGDNGNIEFVVITNKRNGTVNVSVKDSGSGILEEHLENIFDSGFSTKTKKHESGHGLNIVKNIITEHGGNISVSSVQNVGTTFRVTLPIIQTHNTKSLKNKKQKILLVDDDKVILELFSDLLNSYNYTVITAGCGKEALNKFGEHSDFSLLIIDKTLPTIGGVELIETIRKENSDIPIILMSGADEIIEKNLLHLAINKKINKPFDFEFMLSEIQKLLL